ncbi:hypothetical protein V565_067420 [Rhizoctonia solani 123E]|uniref:Fungal-type protein kinase domain-containing protein n=1 Tax=Rhizoctonia solani 123E TaxID=1423351 RepID=A0A074S2I1_9AGAM|nr:hypothetical protein V565_067420 [Rhizoctonia solani 123E]
MAHPHYLSSPIKQSVPLTDVRSTTQTTQDIHRNRTVQVADGENFRHTYLLPNSPKLWDDNEKRLVDRIQRVTKGQEKSLYTGYAPLLRLLNSMSGNVAKEGQEVLVFRAGNKCRVKHPFADQYRYPDIIVQWERSDAFQEMNYTEDVPSEKIWTELATVGEVKVSGDVRDQLTGYLQNHLRFHPELNGALAFSVRSTGYALCYHDAAVVHRSEFQWEPEPLYEFIAKLYTRPFRDPSMQIQSAQAPIWATRNGNIVYMSKPPNTPGGPDAQGGPGQRRYTTEAEAEDTAKGNVFIKDIWRSQQRYFFEGLLVARAHDGRSLAGLAQLSHYGYVLDETGKPIRTTRFNPGPGTEETPGRFKMRTVTSEIGQPLEGVHSLYKFLCTMYDACAVQRNLYRKCKILHRDISDKNIMFAPDTDAYRKRNREGYADVKFVNQVLAKDKSVNPAPQCLVIDLGNGADLNVERGLDALTERTGTPKFIARSVSSGELLGKKGFSSKEVDMPLMEGVLAEYLQFMHATEYQVLDSPSSTIPSEAEFAHRLFHDAESTFWVIAWTLARSIKVGSEQEEIPHIKFRQFFHTMSTHCPTPEADDPRKQFSHNHWEFRLHPDLAALAPMLANMFEYVQPEWAYRPELNVEHVHEALMRLLLIEIVNIKNGTDIDIDIDIGGRDPPPPTSRTRSSPPERYGLP